MAGAGLIGTSTSQGSVIAAVWQAATKLIAKSGIVRAKNFNIDGPSIFQDCDAVGLKALQNRRRAPLVAVEINSARDDGDSQNRSQSLPQRREQHTGGETEPKHHSNPNVLRTAGMLEIA
ncbi:hypothetical protein ACLIR7_09085 [Nitratireductor aquimarinus]|uniref:hypothetical protein n=1 Tax=Nitratireductor aquimarinus TaxID=889300 RepID=UPI00398E7FE6